MVVHSNLSFYEKNDLNYFEKVISGKCGILYPCDTNVIARFYDDEHGSKIRALGDDNWSRLEESIEYFKNSDVICVSDENYMHVRSLAEHGNREKFEELTRAIYDSFCRYYKKQHLFVKNLNGRSLDEVVIMCMNNQATCEMFVDVFHDDIAAYGISSDRISRTLAPLVNDIMPCDS